VENPCEVEIGQVRRMEVVTLTSKLLGVNLPKELLLPPPEALIILH
jgi:hypothetical protein